MNRNSLLNTNSITYAGLNQSSINTFRDFVKLSGDKKLNIESRQQSGYTIRESNIPYVLAESGDASGRTAYLYFEKKYFIGNLNDRFHDVENNQYYVVAKDTLNETKFTRDPYRIVYEIIRVKVEIFYSTLGHFYDASNRVVFPHYAIYYVTTTTPANATFFGYGRPTLTNPNDKESEEVTSTSPSQGGLAAGQHGGLCLFAYERFSYSSNYIYSNYLYSFQIATNMDAAYFGRLIDKAGSGLGAGSNNEIAVFRLGYDGALFAEEKYERVAFNTLNNAISHGTAINDSIAFKGCMSCSNSTNDTLLIAGGYVVSSMEYTKMSIPTNSVVFGNLAYSSAYLACTCNGTNNRAVLIGSPVNQSLPMFAQLVDLTTASDGTSWGNIPCATNGVTYSANLQAGCDGNQNRMVFQASVNSIQGLMYTDMSTLVEASIFGTLDKLAVKTGYNTMDCPSDTNL